MQTHVQSQTHIHPLGIERDRPLPGHGLQKYLDILYADERLRISGSPSACKPRADPHSNIGSFLHDRMTGPQRLDTDKCWWCSCGKRQTRHHLFTECWAWAPQIRRLWKRIGRDYQWQHPRAPSVRWLWDERATEVVLECLGDTKVGCRVSAGKARADCTTSKNPYPVASTTTIFRSVFAETNYSLHHFRRAPSKHIIFVFGDRGHILLRNRVHVRIVLWNSHLHMHTAYANVIELPPALQKTQCAFVSDH